MMERRRISVTLPPHHHCCGARGRRGGYVLVVTLGLLILAASLMVAVSRGAMGHAAAARSAGDELRRRWAGVSCRSAVLPYAESILATAEAQRRVAMPVGRVTITLSDQTLDLTIGDELAK